LIAHIFRNSSERRVAPAQEIGGKQHSPLRQVLHGRIADQNLKTLCEHRPRSSGVVRQLFQRPGMSRTRVHRVQCRPDDSIAHPG
jgi:hypothetical protein